MIIFKSINKLNKEVNFKAKIGFVPTMGSLHKGHISLIKSSQKNCKKTRVSSFINPSQFNKKNDLKNYPRNLKKDINILKKRFDNCKFVIQKNQNGTADAVILAKKFINNKSNILILFGDVPLITLSTLKKLTNNFISKKLFGLMLAFNSSEPFGYGRVVTKGRKVQSVIEEINASQDIKKISLCNAGVILCKYELLFSFINKISNKNKKKEKYLPDIFSICHQNKKSFQYILCDEEEMLGINTFSDFNKLMKFIKIFLETI